MAVRENYKFNFEEFIKILERGIVVLPLLTAIAYLGSFFFEVSYLGTYNLPQHLARIKVENFVFLFLASIIACAVTMGVYDSYLRVKDRKKNPLHKLMFVLLIVVVVLWLLLVLPPSISAILFISASVLVVLRVTAPSFIKSSQDSELRAANTRVGRFLAITVCSTMLVCIFSYMAGRFWAIVQDNYAVLEDKTARYALLQTYGDLHILGRIDNDKIKDYILVDTDYLSGKTLHTEKLKINKFKWSEWLEEAF